MSEKKVEQTSLERTQIAQALRELATDVEAGRVVEIERLSWTDGLFHLTKTVEMKYPISNVSTSVDLKSSDTES